MQDAPVTRPTTPTLETPRLRLEPAWKYARALFPLFADGQSVAAWNGWETAEPHPSPDFTERMFGDPRARRTPEWAILRRDRAGEQAIMGLITVHDSLVPGIGYLIGKPYRRQGYGAEAMRAALEYVFTALRYDRVELWINSDNAASQRLAYKVGFRPVGQFNQHLNRAGQVVERIVFGLRAQAWAIEGGLGQDDVPATLRTPFYGIEPVLEVVDVGVAVAFYRDRLRFDVTWIDNDDAPTFAIVSRGEWSFERASLHLAHVEKPGTPGALFIPVGIDVDRLHAEFAAQGVKILQPPALAPYGRRAFTIADLNGWRLTFASSP